MNPFRRRGGLSVATIFAVVAACTLARAPAALAAHDAGDACYSCHTLDDAEGDSGTSYINRLSRTFPRIKDYDGLPPAQSPANLGCTYCHDDNGRTDRMKPAITHFQGRTSSHPVGFNFSTDSDTNNEFLSTLGSATAQELDCVDCHDLTSWADGRDDPDTLAIDEGADGDPATSLGGATDKYPEHGRPVDPVNNPFMLRDVTVADEYDGLCRGCHRSDAAQTVKGVSLQLLAHADGAPGRPLRESDGTVLRTADLDGDGVPDAAGLAATAQCTVCHDTHYSTNRRLFNDGHEQHKTGTGMVADAPVTSGNCTGFCHYAGDWDNLGAGGNYFRHGHGMAESTYKYKGGKPDAGGSTVTMGYGCTACHVGLDPAQQAHADKNPTGTDQERYIKRFNLSGTLQATDTGSAMGNPLVGICLSCHQSYEEHRTASLGGVGCQDCHDEHAEGVGSASNVMMIPERAKKPGSYVAPDAAFAAKPGTEVIAYDSTKYDTATNPYAARSTAVLDFFRQGDANGICDSAECHGGKGYTPLSTWINNAGTSHKGGQQTPGADCNSCHKHNGDVLGGWRAQSSCEDCHADATGASNTTNLPRTHGNATESLTVHSLHAGSSFAGSCAVCHAHDGKTDSPHSAADGTLHMDGVVNFNGTRMPGTGIDYSAMDYGGSCVANNTCHDSEAGEWRNGLDANGDACADCHDAGTTGVVDRLLDQGGWPVPTKSGTGRHAQHVNSFYVTGDGVATAHCTDCHGATADAGTHTGHKDGVVDVATSGTNVKVSGYAAGDKTCENSCHAAGLGVVAKRWTDGVLACTDCHAGSFLGGGANAPASGLHAVTPSITGNAHDGAWDADGADGAAAADCVTCHSATPTNPAAGHINGTFDASVGSLDASDPRVHLNSSVGFVDAATPTCGPAGGAFTTCHGPTAGNGDAGSWRRRWDASAASTDGTECANCHGGFANDWTFGGGAHNGADNSVEHGYNWDGDASAELMAAGTHQTCRTCHGANSASDRHAGYTAGASFWNPRDGSGMHGDGAIQMNGPQPATGTGYDETNFGCSNAAACHANDAGHRLENSNWSVSAVNFGGASCTTCHGYPPTGADDGGTNYNLHAAGAEAVNHDSITPGNTVALKGNHNDCGICHGVKANATMDGFLAQDPGVLNGSYAYVPATDHKDGSVTMNDNGNASSIDDANYNPSSGGCANAACHLDDANHQLDPAAGTMPTVSPLRARDIGPGSCSGCHGTTGTNIYPDGGAQNGTAYENRAGAHQKHVAAIVARNAGVSAGDASTCNWCHPFGGHSGDQSAPPADVMDGASAEFRTITGGSDADGAFVSASSTCTNVDCHAGTTTPGWYVVGDAAAPVWTPNSGIAASNPNLGGILNVTWNAAVDAYPSNPVTYDLYRSTTNSAAAVFAGPPIATDLSSTSTQVTGLVVGTTYYFGVRAKDNWAARNVTANTDISAGVAPGAAPWAPGSKSYYLTRSSGAGLWGATTTNLNTCGTPTTGLAVAGAPLWPTMPGPTTPPPGRGLLTATRACSASTGNYMESSASTWPGQWRNFAGFYSAPYPGRTVVQGASATFGFQGYYYFDGSDPYNPILHEEWALVVLAAVDAGGITVATSANSVQTPPLSNAMASYTLNLSTLTVTVPEGGRLAVLIYFYDHPNSGAAVHRMAHDNYDPAITNQITVNETLQDVSPPNWTGGVSGVTVQDAGTGGALDVFWNSATDLPAGAPTPPVQYDLYRVQSASCTDLWINRVQAGLGSPHFLDTGLTNGLTYCYGVRAKDSWVPPNVTGNTDTATGTPSLGTTFGCAGCHASPPTTGNNAGSHAAHANSDPDHTDCDKCHPGTTSYANDHQDGSGQLAFDGTAATAVYNGNQLSYTDNAQVIYNDTDGYGILTGSAGDGVDDGSCGGTPSDFCHGTGTPAWGSATEACTSCHSGQTIAPVVTMASAHVTAPGGAGSCKDCHAGHYQGVRIPLPPASWSNPNLSATDMRTRLGINYTNAGGINIGGPGTVASISTKITEAETCWGCHDAVSPTPVSEWGYNTKTTPAGFPVVTFATADGNPESHNYGWLYASTAYTTKTSDWTQGYWMSPYDPLLKRRVASIHTASLDPAGESASVAANVRANGTVERTSPILEDKSRIRCSYCHDVHNTFGPSGKPYLRGTWAGDPYPPELPPRSSYAYTTAVKSVNGQATPRAKISARDKGGYFIDQNSNSPTNNAAMDTLAETAGLCTLCHGTSVNTMDYYAGSKLWRTGTGNGHSNSALGGTGAAKADLFSATRYGCGMGMQLCAGGCCDTNYPQYECGSPSYCGTGSCGGCQIIDSSGWCGTDCGNWYGAGTIGGASGPGTMAHKFTCSKCHSPHASGLPALLPQNCVDPSLGNFTVNGYNGLNVAANNCHRKTSTADGWHVLAPGQ